MSDVAITPVVQAVNVASVDLLGVGTVISSTSNVFVITPPAKGPASALGIIFEADGTGDTVTILAGDNPPGLTQARGDLTITLAASDIKIIWIEAARFMHDDGKIRATCGDTGTLCYVIAPPPGLAGGSGVA